MPILPEFDSANFDPGAAVDNPFFPLKPGTIHSHGGSAIDEETGKPFTESNDFFTTSLTKMIEGVQTVVVRDTAYTNGILVEDTLDWHAQDKDGNVWYLGEISYNFEYDDDGNYIETNTDGSWEAGIDGALPGWIMKADPGFGASYYNEFYPGEAVDEAIVIGVDLETEIGLGTYDGVVKTLDTSELEPDVAGAKYFAPGIGNILVEEGLGENNEAEFISELRGIRQLDGLDVDPDENGAGEEESTGADADGDEADTESEDDVSFALGDLMETQMLQGFEDAEDPEADDFEGGDTEVYVTFLGEDAGFNNSVGAYTFDSETGVIGEARILFTDTDGADAGDSVAVHVESGDALGLFIVQNGGNLGVDLTGYENGGLFFTDMLTGGPATIGDQMAPAVAGADGTLLPIPAFHALGNDDGFNLLNPGAGINAVELDSDLVEGHPSGDISILGFEDLRVTNPSFDGDFNDVVLTISEAPLTDDLVGGLLEEMDTSANPML